MSNEIEIEKQLELSPTAAVDSLEATMERLIETADVQKVYGAPVIHGESMVIPAAEVFAVAGMGVGFGSGADEKGNDGSGGGGGGGGRALSRPVAVIIASPNGVRVEPVVDVTKIGLAALTTFGFIFGLLVKMRRGPSFSSDDE